MACTAAALSYVAATADAANGSAGSASHVLRPRWLGRSNRGAKRGRRLLDACGAYVARLGPVQSAVGPREICIQGFSGHYHKKKILSLLFTALFLRVGVKYSSVSAYLPGWQKQVT